MQTSEGTVEEPPLVEIDLRGQTYEVYVVSTDGVAEAAFLIREVLVDDCYLKHGLQITPGATVVDIGANIGLFGVRALSAVLGGDVTYIGVEPVPANFTALQYNLLGGTCSTVSTCGVGSTSGTTSDAAGDHGGAGSTAAEQSFFHLNAAYADAVAAPSVHRISRPYPGNILLVNAAVSNRQGNLPITYYPRMPGNSTLRPLEKASLQQHLMPAFFSAVEQFEVRVIMLQQLLQEAVPDGSRIDLLKVDVEGEELAVLQGLDTAGWQRVQQVVVEVHDCSASAPESVESIAALPVTLPCQPSAVSVSDVDGHWISFVHGALSTHVSNAADESSSAGQTVLQVAAPPRPDGRVMAIARLLMGLGFRVVIECSLVLAGAPSSYNVFARRPRVGV